MGNEVSVEPEPQRENPHTAAKFDWPDNLYVESRDFAAVAFFIYTWGYILDSTGKDPAPDKIELTPTDVNKIVVDNYDALNAKYKEEFPKNSDGTMGEWGGQKNFELLTQREKGSSLTNPLTVVKYDYRFQTSELVYAITKDDINKRITLVFRGTENSLAFKTNWGTNIDFPKIAEPTPGILKGKIGGDKIWFHGGFHEYLNDPTEDPDDGTRTKKQQILDSVKALSSKYPNYKICCTGHSLGAALSCIMSYYLAIDDELPKPITCMNYASPRVGDGRWLEAITELERNGSIRFCRFVNENDSVTVVPMFNYSHVGFQITLNKRKRYKPEVDYPKLNGGVWGRLGRTWDNSVFASLNLGYDHSAYMKRIELHKEELQELDLNKLYANKAVVGYESQL